MKSRLFPLLIVGLFALIGFTIGYILSLAPREVLLVERLLLYCGTWLAVGIAAGIPTSRLRGVRLGRSVFVTLCAVFGFGLAHFFLPSENPALDELLRYDLSGFAVGLFLGTITVGIEAVLARRMVSFIPTLLFGVAAGFIAALLATPFLYLLDHLLFAGSLPVLGLMFVGVVYLASYIATTLSFQLQDSFKFVIPFFEFKREGHVERPFVVDTSVIIDGRIADVAETGVLTADLIVPRFVLGEVQGLADSADKMRRARGKRGLEVLQRLRAGSRVAVRIHEAVIPDIPDVDGKLVWLAKQLNAYLLTNDFNLNQVAQIQEVPVVNLNALAGALRPVILPGEEMKVKIVKSGEGPLQGVGYLDDGTMVVVEGARDKVGAEVGLTVTSMIQTHAGKMLFGKVK